METQSYRPRLLVILVFMLVVGQFFAFNYLKNDLDTQVRQCYDAINTNSVLQGALVNILVEKDIFRRSELLDEAKNLSEDLRNLIEQEQADGERNSPDFPR
jgi:predicted RND superfamily exporter protein